MLHQSATFKEIVRKFCAFLEIAVRASNNQIRGVIRPTFTERDYMVNMILTEFLVTVVALALLIGVLHLNIMSSVATPYLQLAGASLVTASILSFTLTYNVLIVKVSPLLTLFEIERFCTWFLSPCGFTAFFAFPTQVVGLTPIRSKECKRSRVNRLALGTLFHRPLLRKRVRIDNYVFLIFDLLASYAKRIESIPLVCRFREVLRVGKQYFLTFSTLLIPWWYMMPCSLVPTVLATWKEYAFSGVHDMKKLFSQWLNLLARKAFSELFTDDRGFFNERVQFAVISLQAYFAIRGQSIAHSSIGIEVGKRAGLYLTTTIALLSGGILRYDVNHNGNYLSVIGLGRYERCQPPHLYPHYSTTPPLVQVQGVL